MLKPFKALWILFYAAAIAAGQPNVTGIFNAASWAPSGMINGDIAQGSIFVVTGSGIGPAALQQVTSYPLPTTQGIGGTSIQVTIGSQGFDCIMIYSSSLQVAAILPSRTALGSGTLALIYQGSRAVFPIRVVQSSFAMFAVNERGSGPGVVTDASYHSITPINPAHVGDVLIGWGTGLGGTAGDETILPPQVDLNTGVQVWVGNQPATVLYGGRGSSPGLDQINFTVPAGVAGCYVSVVVMVRGVIGNFTTLSIAPAGQSVCSDSVAGFAAADLKKFQGAGALRTAIITLQNFPAGQSQVSAAFQNLNLTSLAGERGLTGWPSPGNCIAFELLTGGSADIEDPVLAPGLDAGRTLTLTGGTLAAQASVVPSSKGFYSTQLASGALGPGAYSIANASGGADVGAFTAALSVPPAINWTNMGALGNIPRGQDLLITWSGGGSNDAVVILGITFLPSMTAEVPTFEFLCTERASAGQFSVPSLVLTSIPNTAQAQGFHAMTLAISEVPFASFAASGLDLGLVASFNFVSRLSGLQ